MSKWRIEVSSWPGQNGAKWEAMVVSYGDVFSLSSAVRCRASTREEAIQQAKDWCDVHGPALVAVLSDPAPEIIYYGGPE